MGANRPRRHHFVPEMLLRNFGDDEGFLWVGDRKRRNCYRTKPKNVFVEGNLYSNYDYIHGTNSYEYEHTLSRIESNAKAAISSVIEQVRGGRNPQLESELNRNLKEFVIALARRTPESQERVFSESEGNFEEVFDSVVKDLLKGAGYDVPEQDWFDQDPRVLRMKRTMKANHSANLAAGEHHILKEDSERFSRETGWGVALICLPKRSFVIGSHGLTIMQDSVSFGGNWLPIAHDVAIQVTAFPDRGFRLCLDRKNEAIIKSINRATTAQSDMIAGRSEALIRALVGKACTILPSR